MNCDDFRARWLDRESTETDYGFVDGDLGQHRASCSSCATWLARSIALDDLFSAALVVKPPPDLAARLALLPSTVGVRQAAPIPAASPVLGMALEFAALLLIGIGMFVLAGNNFAFSWDGALAQIGTILQAASFIASAPVVPYVQNLAVTALEALATILLLLIGFDRIVGRGELEPVGRGQPGA